MDETAAGLSYRRIGPRLDRCLWRLQFQGPDVGDVTQLISVDMVLIGVLAHRIGTPSPY